MKAISAVAPEMERLSREHFDQVCARCDFFIFHTGGRRILDELVAHLTLAEEQVAPSRASLAEVGNVASVVVFDVLRRLSKIRRKLAPGACWPPSAQASVRRWRWDSGRTETPGPKWRG